MKPKMARGQGSLDRKCTGPETEGECSPLGKPIELSGLQRGVRGREQWKMSCDVSRQWEPLGNLM